AADAIANSRERITFVTASFDGCDVLAARRAGVETVEGDVDTVLAEREFTEHRGVAPGDASGSTGGHLRNRWLAVIALVGLAGLMLRVLVLRSPAGFLNADEAYTGIQSFEILAGDVPVVLGGTVYTLPLEAYLFAPIVAVFGAHLLLLKLLSVALWLAGGVLVASIAARLARRRTGLIAAALFWITPGGMLLLSTAAYAAYASGMVVTLVAFSLALRIVDDEPADWLLGLFGVAAGFGFWLHPMYTATLLPMVAFVLWVRRSPRSWAWVVGGGVVGAGPFLAWNLVNGFPSLDPPIDVEGTYLDRVRTFFTDLLPRAFGLRDGALEWELGVAVGLLLYAALIVLVLFGLVTVVRRGSNTGRFLLPVVLAGAFPIMAIFENLIFAADGRYGAITYPYLVLAAALGVGSLLDGAGRRALLVAGAVAAVWVFGFVLPGVVPLVDDTDGTPNAATNAVVGRLDEVGIERIVGPYWAVHPIDFVADRRIEAAVTPGHPVRFPARQRAVEASPPESVAFVFRTEDDDPALLWLGADAYSREVVGGYVVYIPLAAL
ncbi:MAG: ArnT family glycosyltransferase, partial [Ilumatobacteraceae bacterium]